MGGLRGGWDGFSSLVKQNKKAKICFVIYIPGFFFLNFFCYEVIVKQKIIKRSSNYYSTYPLHAAYTFSLCLPPPHPSPALPALYHKERV